MRTKKQISCRFTPYYRVQQFDAVASVWKPLRGMFTTEAEARNSAAGKGKTRIEIVTEEGRRFI